MLRRYFTIVLVALLGFTSCNWKYEAFKDEPEEGESVFVNSYYCEINGHVKQGAQYWKYSNWDWQTGGFPMFSLLFAGYEHDTRPPRVHLYYGYDFSLTQGLNTQGPHRFVFHLKSDAPFQEGHIFTFPINTEVGVESPESAIYIPFSSDMEAGCRVKILNGTYQFKYNKNEDVHIKNTLDFYYDFEEVIVSLPKRRDWDTYDYSLQFDDGYSLDVHVGDTIRVTNGHFSQTLFGLDINDLYMFVTPQQL